MSSGVALPAPLPHGNREAVLSQMGKKGRLSSAPLDTSAEFILILILKNFIDLEREEERVRVR